MGSAKCTNYVECMQKNLESPMPWVGMYIAAASAACTIAMAADAFNGLRSKKLWLPCKYFSLNAFSLTVLAVAMKLPVDLTTRMLGINDRLARVSSLTLMSTAMANFMTSLGSMENNEIMLNLAASGILVITISGNICINIFQVRHYSAAKLTLFEKIVSTVFMLLLLVMFCSTSVMVPTAKRYIESQYNQMHKRILNEQLMNGHEKFTTDELRLAVRRYWIMTESGSPQFIIARSVTCVTSGVICLLMALTLFEAHMRLPLEYITLGHNSSMYEWSTSWILVIQSIGVVLGTIAPLLRWFTAAQFKSTMIGHKSFKDEFKVEAYWTQSLKHWRDVPLPLKTGLHHKFRKFLHDAKRLLLNMCIGVQILIVMASKLILLVSATFVKGFVKGLVFCHSEEADEFESKAGNGMEMDSSPCVLRLEGEAELPKRTLANICNELDELIRIGKKKQSKNLIKLLQKSLNFNGVREFDSSEIKLLINSQSQLPNCWSLPVVTLTSIAISLPNIADKKYDQLLMAVSEGLYFVKLIEKKMDSNGDLASIRDARDVVWVGIELYRKWLDKDLQKAGQTHKETLHKLSEIAEKTVTNFMADTNNFLVQDPLNWPVKVIAANSMYHITQTILSAHKDDNDQTDNEEMFERLSIMISDILTDCLSNLACVIGLKCHSNVIKEREKSIRQAALLLGESEKILQIIEQRDLPNVDPENPAAGTRRWRAYMKQDIEHPVASVSATFPQTHAGHVCIELER